VGHTHHWRYQPDSAAYAAAWPQVVHDTTRIVQQVSRGIALAGPDRSGPPQIDAMSGIAFNGADTAGCDSFQLLPPGPGRRHWFYCNTRRQGYDLAVTATLLRCHLLLPATFAIGGDGSWHRDWRPARDLVHHLFRHETDRIALTDTTEGLSVEQFLGL
jgi:hypothetical protein